MNKTLMRLAAAVFICIAPINLAKADTHDWSGLFLGVTGGYGFGTSSISNSLGGSTGDYDLDGGLLGVAGGYNFQFDNLVLGIEADASYADIKGDTTVSCGIKCSTELKWLGTVRAKAGYAIGQALPYITGGYAVGGVEASTVATTQSESRTGWTAGAGLEYALSSNLSLKAEYLYTDLGSVKWSLPLVDFEAKADDIQTLRIGLNYNF